MTYPPSLPTRSLLRRAVATTLVGGVGLLVSVCGDAVTDVPGPVATETASAIDGETIYRGLFFGRGELGGLAAEVWLEEVPADDGAQSDPDLVATVHTLQDDMVGWIRQNEPTFLGEFRSALTSGDHVRVDGMLDRAASVSRAAFEDVADDPVHASLELGLEATNVENEAAAIVVVVYRTVAAAIHAVVVVWRIKVVSPMAADGAASALERDEAVARLVSILEGA